MLLSPLCGFPKVIPHTGGGRMVFSTPTPHPHPGMLSGGWNIRLSPNLDARFARQPTERQTAISVPGSLPCTFPAAATVCVFTVSCWHRLCYCYVPVIHARLPPLPPLFFWRTWPAS